jgi:hypothetical protein
MIRVWVEVSGGSRARFRTEVQAETIEQAVHLALASSPGCQCQVLFPIDPETFFIDGENALAANRVEAGDQEESGFAAIRVSA